MHGNDPPQRYRSIILDLFDLRFRYLITPRLVGCLYATALSFIGSAVFFALLFLWGLTTWMGSGWWLFAPVIVTGGLAAMMAARVTLEWVLMTFSRGRSNQ